MKRLLIFLSVISVQISSADERSAAILRALSDTITHCGHYRIDFVSTVESHTIDGFCLVSGDDYTVHVPQTDIFSVNGISYQVDEINKEIVIEPAPEQQNADLLSDPAHAFVYLDKDYTHTYSGMQKTDGRECHLITLKSKSDESEIKLYINTTNNLPVRIEYFLKNINSNAVIDIKSFACESGRKSITFDIRKYDGYEIIDFRR